MAATLAVIVAGLEACPSHPHQNMPNTRAHIHRDGLRAEKRQTHSEFGGLANELAKLQARQTFTCFDIHDLEELMRLNGATSPTSWCTVAISRFQQDNL